MDTFLVYGVDDERGDALVSLEEKGNIAHEVFDENGIIVSLHGHVAFIGALEEGIDGAEADFSAISTSSSIQIHAQPCLAIRGRTSIVTCPRWLCAP